MVQHHNRSGNLCLLYTDMVQEKQHNKVSGLQKCPQKKVPVSGNNFLEDRKGEVFYCS